MAVAGLVVKLADQRIGRWIVARTAYTIGQTAKKQQGQQGRHQPGRQARQQCGRTGHGNTEQHNPLPPKHIACITGQRHHDAVHDHEQRADQTELDLGQAQVIANDGGQVAEDLPIGLGHEEGEPEDDNEFPLVGNPSSGPAWPIRTGSAS